MQGHKYALLLVDEHTTYTWVHFLAAKSQAEDVIKSFIMHQFNLGKAVANLRTDNINGGEFFSSSLKYFLWERKIKHAQSPAYTPQFQGKVERMNRTVGGMHSGWELVCLKHFGSWPGTLRFF
jgi:transposase InsO family protein